MRLAVVGVLCVVGFVRAEDAVRLSEKFTTGYQYHVSSRVQLTGQLTLPAEKDRPARTLPVTGTSKIEYDERILDAAGQRSLRVYRTFDFQRQIGEQVQPSTLRAEVRRLVILRLKQTEVPFSPDGPLLWGEIDLVRTDVFTPALAGLLPTQPVRVGEQWTAQLAAIEELTDLEKVEDGTLTCTLEQVGPLATLGNRRHARISLRGTLRGVNEDGPNRQTLDGLLYFDLEAQHISYMSIRGQHQLLDAQGQVTGRVEGQFTLSRQVRTQCPELRDDVVKTVGVEPTAENTALLYDNPDLGVRFLHPRKWRVAGVRGRQVTLDEANGSGLLITLEPLAQVPTPAQYLTEAHKVVQEQKGQILRIDQPRQLSAAPQQLDHFTLDAEMNRQRVILDYFIARQATGGATLAARLLPTDLAELQREVERIARSVVVTRGP